MATTPTLRPQERIPFWRDTRYIAILLQVLFVIGVVIAGSLLYTNLVSELAQSNVTFDWRFLNQTAGIAIGEGLNYQPTDSYGQAFIVGIYNTLRIAIVGIILSTLLGLVVGIIRLSPNWLARNVAYTYVEIVRNVPVLLQLFFWLAVTQNVFRPPNNATNLFNLVYFTNRGVYIPWFNPTDHFNTWLPLLGLVLLISIGVYFWRRRELIRRDRPGALLSIAVGVFVVGVVLTYIILSVIGRAPLTLEIPVLDGFNFDGGTALTAFYFALLMGLVVYTGAFISEIVRAGILAVSKGQREASRALGLTESQSLQLVILPQAFRVIIPPLINQYLNLTKNSSLAIAIGYPDLFNIGFTIFNQTGQTIPVVLMIMGSYLVMSLTISFILNIVNRRFQIVER
jgi:general L-amino acid transport system permease protein